MSKNPQISRFGRKSRRFVAVALALSIPLAALAQTQLGTVTSSSPFELRGAGINPAPGVPNWPVVSGDTFQAGKTPLTLTLSGGSTVIFTPGARVTVSVMSSGLDLRLESGTVQSMSLRDPGGINVYCKGEKVSITSPTGGLDCGRETQTAALAPVDQTAPTAKNKKKAWLWVAAGGAVVAATVIVLALNNGTPVSPVQCGGVGQPACP